MPRRAAAFICLASAALLWVNSAIAQDAPPTPLTPPLSTPPLTAPTPQTDCVILLHGLARSTKSMKKMDRHLSKKGYRIVNQGYPSRQKTIAALSAPTINAAMETCGQAERISFVTHSLGGILLRHYLSEHEIKGFHRAVMLGPPNQGSEVPDTLGGWIGFEAINGPAGMELGTDQDSVPASLPAADFDVGVIAGTRTINLILSGIIPETDDGKVSVENTKLEGMRDHITLPVSHPFLIKNKKALRQVEYYLMHGKFEREEDEGAALVSGVSPAN